MHELILCEMKIKIMITLFSVKNHLHMLWYLFQELLFFR